MARPIIVLTVEEFKNKLFVREVLKDTCEFMGEWESYNWNTEQLHKPEVFLPYDFEWLLIVRKAPIVFIDHSVVGWDYIHVPYNWNDDECIYRVYPIWELKIRYRTSLHKAVFIKSVKAHKENDKWYWIVSLV
jgi:hypothetical protein